MKKFTRRAVLLAASALGAIGLTAGLAQADLPKLVQKDKYKVGFAQVESNNPWRIAQTESMKAEAAKLGHQLVYTDAAGSAAKQVADVNSMIAQGVDLIFLAPREEKPLIPAVMAAKKAGIPSFLADREINATGVALAQLVSNNYQGATLGAEEFVRLMGEEGDYVELLGKETDTNAHIRSKGYNDILSQYPKLKKVVAQSANWNQAEAFQKMQTIIQQFPNIKGVIAGNDTMALGAYAALKGVGKGKVIVVGFDGSPDVAESIKAGEIKATVLQPVVRLAEMAVEQADKYIKTKATGMDEKQTIDCDLITPENVNNYSAFSLKE